MNIPRVTLPHSLVWRAIPSRFPPVDLFAPVAPQQDWEAITRLEDLTNERARELAKTSGLIKPEDRKEHCKSSYILGPLTHINPEGSMFSDGSYGVLYGALDFNTMLAEVKKQRENFLRNTDERAQRIDMRTILIDLSGDLDDLRGRVFANRAESRELAARLRSQGSFGVIYDSQARVGGECVAIFRPPVLSNPRQERHFTFLWNGTQIVDYLEYTRECMLRLA